MRLSCVVCIYTRQPDDPQPSDDELIFVIGGMSVCLDHAPYVPHRMDLTQAILAWQRDDDRMEKLARQALGKMP